MLKAFFADLEDTQAFCNCFAAVLQAPLNVFLEGQLGAGKTAFVRATLRALGEHGAVPSPTYTLVELYDVGLEVQHFDLYRMTDPEELEMIGGRDYLAVPAVRFIEWPERARAALPEADIEVALSVAGTGRAMTMSAHSGLGLAVLEAIKSQYGTFRNKITV